MLRFSSSRLPAGILVAFVLGVSLFLTSCDVLDVKNPNSVQAEDLESATSAQSLRNGAIATTARAYSYMYALYGTTSDELTWIGSFDAWNQIDRGNIQDPLNQFLELSFPFVGEARYTADLAIDRLESFRERDALQNDTDLLRSYEQGSLIYLLIGDMFENFALSTPDEPAPPVGEDQMDSMYTTAIGYLDEALSIARSQSNTQAEARILATRARAKHGLAVWEKLQSGSTPSDPIVEASGAAEDAEAYLNLVGTDTDQQFQLEYGPSSIDNYVAGQVNDRQELEIGPTYENPSDPLTGESDPRTEALVDDFQGGSYVPLSYVTTREVRLILAESALADGREEDAVQQINIVREFGGLPDYDPDSDSLSPIEMLEYERKANLFMMGQRLHDLYRFGEKSPQWGDESVLMTNPGTIFPVPNSEIESNPNF